MEFLPFALPSIEQDEINEVVDTLRSNWITTGPKTKKFEDDFSKLIGVKHAIAVNSCTAALHLGLEAVGIKEGDMAITSPFTFTASGETIRYLGADPLFADIDEKTFNIDSEKIKQIFENQNFDTSKIKAIIPVHFGGQACDMTAIIEIAKKYNLKIIEDAAHTLPTTHNGKLIGSFGDITCFSFYATKTITTGEGGMLVTNNDDYASRARTMRLHGINRDVFNRYITEDSDWYYEIIAPGFKYNMPDIAAAIGIHQLKKIYKFHSMRQKIAELYNNSFKNIEELEIPFIENLSDLHSWHLYVIKLKLELLKIDRSEFIKQLKLKGIGTSVHFIPLHIQPFYRKRYNFKPNDFPIAYNVFNKVCSLPIYPKMNEEDINRVINVVKEVILKNKKKITV